MLRILWNGRSAMMAQQEKLDCISNNISNVKTEGYKREEVTFQDLVYETLDRRGYPTNSGEDKNLISGTGVKAGRWIRDMEKQGDLVNTGTNTDLAIDGLGFFRVVNSSGQYRYERSGNFSVDTNGDIVDKMGNKLDIQFYGEKTKFTEDSFAVRQDGTVFVQEYSNSGSKTREVGRINIYNAVGDDAFISVGENLYEAVEGVNPTPIQADILSGYLEGSNVDMGKEMTDMLMSQRAFEFGSRALKAADEMWGMVNSLKGR
ncbi:flagellar hook-basal body complex protein [Clostridium rectalis]|uniref:flagellar hook-basal body complex protein n=1 Tax=Clostridium rectalis TaxID=2040295 RepID=UPI000F6352C1|nr:flagellar hook-basal body complex protein [Clostridium rectalis]